MKEKESSKDNFYSNKIPYFKGFLKYSSSYRILIQLPQIHAFLKSRF